MKNLIAKIENSRYSALLQFIKFGIVGVSNTLISYATEMLCFYVFFKSVKWDENLKIAIVSAIAFFVSVTNSYYWNNRFVFKDANRSGWKKHLSAYGKTVLCYALTGLIIAPLLKIWLTDLYIPYWAASLMTLVVTIPLNFIMNKFWAFADKKGKTDEH